MHVLQVHARYRDAGGEDAVVDAEAALLRGAGHRVERLEAANPTGALASAAGLAVSPWSPRGRAAGRRAVASGVPDVAHVHNTWYALSPSVLGPLRRAGVPVVMTLHNFRLLCVNALLYRDGGPCEDCVGRAPWPGVVHRCYRGSAVASAAVAVTIAAHRARRTWDRDVDLFAVPSDHARSRFVAGGLDAERVRVLPNVVADPRPRPAPPSASDTVLFAGRLSPEKGLEDLLHGWRAAAPPGLRLVVAGDGPLRSEVASLAGPGVELTGRLGPEEVARRMLSARALVFPSRWYETFGLVVAEAFAAGLPVLGTDHGAAAELLRLQGPAWAVPPRRDAWAEALPVLADDRAVDAAGRAGRAGYEEQLTPAAGLRRLEALYAEVTG